MPFLTLKIELNDLDDDWQLSTSDKRYKILTAGNSSVSVKNRADYPGTVLEAVNNKIRCGYGNLGRFSTIKITREAIASPCSEEFLLIEVSPGGLEIVRDQFATLPLFLGQSDSTVYISNDFSWVAQQIGRAQLTVNDGSLARFLLVVGMDNSTIFEQISVISDSEYVKIRPDGQLSVSKPLVDVTTAESDPIKFPFHLENIYKSIQKEIDINKAGFEFSGGIDSATAAAWFAAQSKIDAYVMLFPSKSGVTQKAKIADFEKKFDSTVHLSEIKEHNDYPLSRYGNSVSAMFYEYQEIYTEQLDKLASAMEADGKRFVFTGIGGNELFEPYEALKSKKEPLSNELYRKRFSKSNIYSDAVRDVAADSLKTHRWPRALLAESVIMAHTSRNNTYIEKDIWPISPFASPELFVYTSNLPAAFRIDKMILRSYHESQDYPKSIYAPEINENFGRYFQKFIHTDFKQRLSLAYSDSILKSKNWINEDYVENVINNPHQITSRDCLQLFTLAVAELNLH